MDPPRADWLSGTGDLFPGILFGGSLVLLGLASSTGPISSLSIGLAGLAGGTLVRRIPRGGAVEWAPLPPLAALTFEVSQVAPTLAVSVVAALSALSFLLWLAADPVGGLRSRGVGASLAVPTVGVGLALAVFLLLPFGTEGQIGLAAALLAVVFGLAAWLYPAAEAEEPSAGPTA